MSALAFSAGMKIAADFIATQFGQLLALPPDARPGAWCEIHAQAMQDGIITPMDWPATYSEEFCRYALSNVWWLSLDRLPIEMAVAVDGLDDGERAKLRETAEFVIAHLPTILPRADRQKAWRELCAANASRVEPRADDAPLAALLAQAVLIERHLRAGDRPAVLH
jgi:hypothetical protein